ncbi:hypothetical protein GCM10028807_03410 [Spirosoma daeguense]
MTLPNIFTKTVSENIIQRINQLQTNTQPNWGKMNAPQMLAHCNVAYEMVYDNKHPKPNALVKLLLKAFAKRAVTGPASYKRNTKTAPVFLITNTRNFNAERKRLIDYIGRTQQLGEDYFDGKESHSFGRLNKDEWNNMFYKHLDHHLTQFGV